VLHTEEAEARGEEKGIAGQADQRGADPKFVGRVAALAEAVDSVLQQILGDVTVRQAVAGNQCHVVNEPKAEREAGQ